MVLPACRVGEAPRNAPRSVTGEACKQRNSGALHSQRAADGSTDTATATLSRAPIPPQQPPSPCPLTLRSTHSLSSSAQRSSRSQQTHPPLWRRESRGTSRRRNNTHRHPQLQQWQSQVSPQLIYPSCPMHPPQPLRVTSARRSTRPAAAAAVVRPCLWRGSQMQQRLQQPHRTHSAASSLPLHP